MGAESQRRHEKETTSLYGRLLDQHVERAFDVMGDMLRPALTGRSTSRRQVVIEEIVMYEETEPSDKVHDVLAEASVRPDQPSDARSSAAPR